MYDLLMEDATAHYARREEELGSETMREIVRVHFADIENKLLDQALESFYRLRNIKELQKKFV